MVTLTTPHLIKESIVNMETNHNIVNTNISSSNVYMGSSIMGGGTEYKINLWYMNKRRLQMLL